jgi:TRAP-type C4-dicarboxylate transport system permease small subunit
VSRWLDRLEEGACVLLLAVMTGVAFLNVITRCVVRYSLAFTEEVVVSLFVWLTLFGASVAFREGTHLGFTWAVGRLPRPLQRGAVWVQAVLALVLFGALVHFGLGQIRSERLLGTTSEALAIPQWWYTAGIPAIGVLILVRILQGALRADRQRRG